MKRNVIFMCAFAAFALVLSGCGGCGGGGRFGEVVDAMEYGNADELGGIVKKCRVAEYNGDFDALWDMMSKKSHEEVEAALKDFNKDETKKARNKIYDEKIKSLKKKVEDEKDEKKKGFLQRAVEWNKDLKEKENNIETAKEFYMHKELKNIGIRVVVGEKIENDEGVLEMINMSSGEFSSGWQKFVKEDGEWKIK